MMLNLDYSLIRPFLTTFNPALLIEVCKHYQIKNLSEDYVFNYDLYELNYILNADLSQSILLPLALINKLRDLKRKLSDPNTIEDALVFNCDKLYQLILDEVEYKCIKISRSIMDKNR